MTSTADHASTILQIAHAATRARRVDLLGLLVGEHGRVVQSGPFAGTVLSDRASWGDGDLLPKLIGCYESELHPVIEEIVASVPDLIINIGAAEGYYAAGMARRVPEALVHAFDTDSKSQDICRQTAALNDAASRMSVSGLCSADLLQAIVPRGRRPVVICDCEGYERDLIDPRRVPSLRAATLVVECHDFLDASITPTLVERLSATHDLAGLREAGRDPNEFPFLQRLDSLDRWLAVCEYRPTMMHWLVARPK